MAQKKTIHGLPQAAELTEEQKKQILDARREQEAIGQRAKVTGNLLTTIIRTYPDLTPEEVVDKATKIAEVFMDKLLGVTFTKA